VARIEERFGVSASTVWMARHAVIPVRSTDSRMKAGNWPLLIVRQFILECAPHRVRDRSLDGIQQPASPPTVPVSPKASRKRPE
jgi:hypothetical protein